MSVEYQEAMRGWFISKAHLSQYYGWESEGNEMREHVKNCALTWYTEPELDRVGQFVGTFADDQSVEAITATFDCACGKIKRGRWMRSKGDYSGAIIVITDTDLSEIIKGVLAYAMEQEKK